MSVWRKSRTATDWPAVGSRVRVVSDDEDAWLGPQGGASRVEDARPGAIAVAEPRGAGGVEPPRAGTAFELRWVGGRGLQVLPVRFTERRRDGIALWWCEPAGPVELKQRRAHVRVRAVVDPPVRVLLEWSSPFEGFAAGTLVDLSEGGLRARVKGWPGREGVPVLVRLTVPRGAAGGARGGQGARDGSRQYDLRGTALRGLTPDGVGPSAGMADVSVQFEQPVPRADELRSLVFEWQRAERRADLD